MFRFGNAIFARSKRHHQKASFRYCDYTSRSLKEDRVAMTLAIHLQSATVQLIFRRALDRDEQDRLDRCFLGFKLQSKLFEDIEHGWCRWIGKSQLLGGGGSAIGTGWSCTGSWGLQPVV
jgi:hypothetical protein